MMNSIVSDIRTAVILLLAADFWRRLAAGLKEIYRAICMLLCRLAQGRLPPPPPARNDCCIQLPPDVYKRADPLIYSQYYLMAQGLAVTWDNPDIYIFDGVVLVTGPLRRDHEYRVRVAGPHVPCAVSRLQAPAQHQTDTATDRAPENAERLEQRAESHQDQRRHGRRWRSGPEERCQQRPQ